MLLPLIIIGLFTAVHAMMFAVSYGIYIYIGILLIVIFVSWRLVFPVKPIRPYMNT